MLLEDTITHYHRIIANLETVRIEGGISGIIYALFSIADTLGDEHKL